MKNKLQSKLPSFFYANSLKDEPDSGYETLQDFFLSWTIRCAHEDYKMVNPLLNKYARKIVFAMIYGRYNLNEDLFICEKFNDEFIVRKVNIWRQWGSIDLNIELDVADSKNSETKAYALNVENKCYQPLGNTQLERYSKTFKDFYKNKQFEIINLLITNDYERDYPAELKVCDEFDYRFLTIVDLYKYAGMKEKALTNNDLFDEYWFYSWSVEIE